MNEEFKKVKEVYGDFEMLDMQETRACKCGGEINFHVGNSTCFTLKTDLGSKTGYTGPKTLPNAKTEILGTCCGCKKGYSLGLKIEAMLIKIEADEKPRLKSFPKLQ